MSEIVCFCKYWKFKQFLQNVLSFRGGFGKKKEEKKEKELSLSLSKHYVFPILAMSSFTAVVSFCIAYQKLRQCFICTITYHICVFCSISKKVFVHHIVTLFLWKCRIICRKVMCWNLISIMIKWWQLTHKCFEFPIMLRLSGNYIKSSSCKF